MICEVFFYGLYMDRDVRAALGAPGEDVGPGCVEGFRMVVGRLSTLTPAPGERAWGMLSRHSQAELAKLYPASTHSAYRPLACEVALTRGERRAALAYVAAPEMIGDWDADVAAKLDALLARLGLPGLPTP